MARSIKKELAALLLAAAVLAPGQASASKLEVTSKADTANCQQAGPKQGLEESQEVQQGYSGAVFEH